MIASSFIVSLLLRVDLICLVNSTYPYGFPITLKTSYLNAFRLVVGRKAEFFRSVQLEHFCSFFGNQRVFHNKNKSIDSFCNYVHYAASCCSALQKLCPKITLFSLSKPRLEGFLVIVSLAPSTPTCRLLFSFVI